MWTQQGKLATGERQQKLMTGHVRTWKIGNKSGLFLSLSSQAALCIEPSTVCTQQNTRKESNVVRLTPSGQGGLGYAERDGEGGE